MKDLAKQLYALIFTFCHYYLRETFNFFVYFNTLDTPTLSELLFDNM